MVERARESGEYDQLIVGDCSQVLQSFLNEEENDEKDGGGELEIISSVPEKGENKEEEEEEQEEELRKCCCNLRGKVDVIVAADTFIYIGEFHLFFFYFYLSSFLFIV